MQCPQVEETVMESKPHSALGWPCSTLLFIWLTVSDLSAYLVGREGIKHRLGNSLPKRETERVSEEPKETEKPKETDREETGG